MFRARARESDIGTPPASRGGIGGDTDVVTAFPRGSPSSPRSFSCALHSGGFPMPKSRKQARALARVLGVPPGRVSRVRTQDRHVACIVEHCALRIREAWRLPGGQFYLEVSILLGRFCVLLYRTGRRGFVANATRTQSGFQGSPETAFIASFPTLATSTLASSFPPLTIPFNA
ncbi:hypothetical protein OF83DRAFT_1085697 [Amylostereum chailletii]|nr:hypothetical protein OF83DRAFT_1085697 [Amylostereum chailletii]